LSASCNGLEIDGIEYYSQYFFFLKSSLKKLIEPPSTFKFILTAREPLDLGAPGPPGPVEFVHVGYMVVTPLPLRAS
jgi:hypothetical protein